MRLVCRLFALLVLCLCVVALLVGGSEVLKRKRSDFDCVVFLRPKKLCIVDNSSSYRDHGDRIW